MATSLIHSWIQDQWQLARHEQSLPFRCLTAPLAVVYRKVATSRLSPVLHNLDQPVVSVGNIRVGGTGKTPVVAALAQVLKERGLTAYVLSRGYGSGLASDKWFALESGEIIGGHKPPRLPDEPNLLSHEGKGLIVVCGASRFDAATKALAQGLRPPDVWLLDDGFQHRQLARDVDIVLVDGQAPFGNGCTLPAGPLREDPKALNRATHVLYTRIEKSPPSPPAELSPWQERLGAVDLVGGTPKSLLEGGEWTGGLVDVVTAVARPDRVEKNLTHQGGRIRQRIYLPDHALFEQAKIAQLKGPIVTTAKDYYRQPDLFRPLNVQVFIIPWSASLNFDVIESILSKVTQTQS